MRYFTSKYCKTVIDNKALGRISSATYERVPQKCGKKGAAPIQRAAFDSGGSTHYEA